MALRCGSKIHVKLFVYIGKWVEKSNFLLHLLFESTNRRRHTKNWNNICIEKLRFYYRHRNHNCDCGGNLFRFRKKDKNSKPFHVSP